MLVSSPEGSVIDGRGGKNTVATAGGVDKVICGSAGKQNVQVDVAQKSVEIEKFNPSNDVVTILGAVNEKSIKKEVHENANTLITVAKTGTKVIVKGVLPE